MDCLKALVSMSLLNLTFLNLCGLVICPSSWFLMALLWEVTTFHRFPDASTLLPFPHVFLAPVGVLSFSGTSGTVVFWLPIWNSSSSWCQHTGLRENLSFRLKQCWLWAQFVLPPLLQQYCHIHLFLLSLYYPSFSNNCSLDLYLVLIFSPPSLSYSLAQLTISLN